jgi:hypothetical protein
MSYNNNKSALPTHAYYTLNFRNNGINGEAEDARVDYLEVRNSPYLMEPDLYSCSIIRFSLTTATLPIFIPQMASDFSNTVGDPTYQRTVYSVTMEYGGSTRRTYVQYTPQTTGLTPSPAGDETAATTNPYYYIYQAAQFVVMVNEALAECFAAVVPLDGANNATKCPVYIDWIDKESQAILYAPSALCQEPGYASQPPAGGATVAVFGTGYVTNISGAGNPWQASLLVYSTAGLSVGRAINATAGSGALYSPSSLTGTITAITSTPSTAIPGSVFDPVIGSGTVSDPWVADFKYGFGLGTPASLGIAVGEAVSATPGTGTLFGGVPQSAVVIAVAPDGFFYKITYAVIGGTIPVGGTVTNFIATANAVTYQVTGGNTPVAGTVTNITSSVRQLKVWFNSALFNLFSSFQAIKEPFSFANQATDLGKHFRYQWWNLYNSTEQTAETFIPPNLLGRAPAAEAYVAINQSYSTVPLWNPVKSIVFTTALLPVLPEMVSAPQALGTTTYFTNNGNNANVQNVLTDFEVELVNGEETRPVIYYFPTAEFRMVDLQGNQPLNAIQLSVGWRNKFGELIPLNLGTDGNAQIKIMFRRRDWQS